MGKEKLKVAFVGSVTFSWETLSHLLGIPEATVVAVITKSRSTFNADHRSLKDLADSHGIPCFLCDNGDSAQAALWLRNMTPDVIFCFGWSHLLKPELIAQARLGAIGFHPAKLPENRGRHPLIWALALGLRETASSFFFVVDEADAGPILSQRSVGIALDDSAQSLYEKIIQTAKQQISEFVPALATGKFKVVQQASSEASTWRKRSARDGEIDWRMPAEGIHNLVRALGKPYPGAEFVWEGKPVKIWKTRISNLGKSNDEPGKILEVGPQGTIIVKCGIGSIELLEHEMKSTLRRGEYL